MRCHTGNSILAHSSTYLKISSVENMSFLHDKKCNQIIGWCLIGIPLGPNKPKQNNGASLIRQVRYSKPLHITRYLHKESVSVSHEASPWLNTDHPWRWSRSTCNMSILRSNAPDAIQTIGVETKEERWMIIILIKVVQVIIEEVINVLNNE